MTLVTTKRGTGITKREVFSIHLDAGDPAENARLVRELLRQTGRTAEQRLDEIHAGAAAILSKAELPVGPGLYAFDSSGNWHPVSRPNEGRRWESAAKIIAPIADAAGFACDSAQGYAARIVDCISAFREARAEGYWDDAFLSGIRLGSLLTEFDLKTGPADGPSRGGIKGARSRWGSHDSRTHQKMLCEEFDRARDAGLSRMAAYAEVARKRKVSQRSVQRAVRNWTH
jgi:hypothetical protein